MTSGVSGGCSLPPSGTLSGVAVPPSCSGVAAASSRAGGGWRGTTAAPPPGVSHHCLPRGRASFRRAFPLSKARGWNSRWRLARSDPAWATRRQGPVPPGRWARAGQPERVRARVGPSRPNAPARGRASVAGHRRRLAGPCPTPALWPLRPARPENWGPASASTGPAPPLPRGEDGGSPGTRRSRRRARPKRPAQAPAPSATHDAPVRGVSSKRSRARLGEAVPRPRWPRRPRARAPSVRCRRPKPPTAGPTPLRKASHRPRPAAARRWLLPLRPPRRVPARGLHPGPRPAQRFVSE